MSTTDNEIFDSTETGIKVITYSTDKANGLVTITKGENGNYFHTTRKVTVGIVDGTPALVEAAPTVLNINAQSIADMRSALAANEARITAIRTQLNAIEADMAAL